MDEFLHNEKIMNYLDGLMNADEKSDFESQLKQSPELQQQLADLQIAIEAVRQFGTKKRVGNLHREMIKELKPQKSSAMNERLRYDITSKGFVLRWENLDVPVAIR